MRLNCLYVLATDKEKADTQAQPPDGETAADTTATELDGRAEEAGASEAQEGEPEEDPDPRSTAEAMQMKRNA